ncbi:MAG: hypothetical protein LBE30_13170 [Comamonas sp.]|jgi:hypothetical protein|nr:hypothetical protein [Comamonas sp.]
MLLLRSPHTIAQELFEANDIAQLQPGHRWPAREISGDCVFLDARQALSELQGRDVPLAQLGQSWWVFAASGTGDAWLMSLDGQQRIGFLDHDDGQDAIVQPMALDFGQWLQLADLMRQWETLADELDEEALAAPLNALLEQISPGLSQRYPYVI